MPAVNLPIPPDVRATGRWPQLLLDLAMIVGEREALLLAEALGGQELYIPKSPRAAKGRVLAGIIGEEPTRRLCDQMASAHIEVPIARAAILEAQRQPFVVRARLKEISVAEAARLTGSSRKYMSRVVNHGWDSGAPKPATAIGRGKTERLAAIGRQMSLFADD